MVNRDNIYPLRVKNPDFDSKWFQERIAHLGMTNKEFGEALDLTESTICRRLSGERPFKPVEFERIATLFRVSTDEVMRRAGYRIVSDSDAQVSIAGAVSLSTGHLDLSRGRKRTADRPPKLPVDGVALRVSDRGEMSGWMVYYVPHQGVDPEAVGRLSVMTVGGASYVAVLQRGRDPGRWAIQRLCADAPMPGMDNVVVESAAPVVWIRT